MKNIYLALLFSVTAAFSQTLECDYNKKSTNKATVNESYKIVFAVDFENKTCAICDSLGCQTNLICFGKPVYNIMTILENEAGIEVTTVDSLMNSVHSKHLISDGVLIESQYYGTCKEIKPSGNKN